MTRTNQFGQKQAWGPFSLETDIQASSRGEAKDCALLSSRDAGLLEPPERPQGSPASSSVWREDPGRVRLLATPWTAAYQAPWSMGFSRQEYWSGVPEYQLVKTGSSVQADVHCRDQKEEEEEGGLGVEF